MTRTNKNPRLPILSIPLLFTAVMITALNLPACGGGRDIDGPAPQPLTQSPAPGTVGDGRLPEILEWARASQGLPAMAVVVVRNGLIAESAVVGQRSMSSSAPATMTDRWHLGSITKSMTATVAAMLVEDGLITWDTRPIDVWPELAQNIDAGFRDITLRQLLSHTSGMKRDDDCSCASDSASGTIVQKRRNWADHLLRETPRFTAGEHNYSNVGYVVAGAMLETRAQSSWESLVQSRLFVPLGMTHSGFGEPASAGQVDEPWGHWSESSGYSPVAPGTGGDLRAAMGPAGNAHTTLDDFARYLNAHLDGERGIPGILSVDSFRTLHTTVSSSYALGWNVVPDLQRLGAPGFAHGGSNGRWFAQTWFSPAKSAALLVVTNGGGDRGGAGIGAADGVIRARIAATP
jgi:CubicO group peptidase (beta-lactamase class C family)